MYDAIIVGGGPAGLSAALILGRCLRSVLVCDAGHPRNASSHALHAYLTREGISPLDFLQTARDELKKFEKVSIVQCEVTKATRRDGQFEVTLLDGRIFQSRKLLLATGVVDVIPKIHGIMDFFGKSVFNCPYCDGWEVRHQKLAVYGKAHRGLKLAKSLKTWSNDILLCTDGPSGLSKEDCEVLERNNIQLVDHKIIRLEGDDGRLKKIIFENGDVSEREAMFFNTESYIRSRLLEQFECNFSEEDGVERGKYEKTEIPGLYVAGNILREVQLVIVAAAEGAQAAFGINSALAKEDLN